MKYKIVLFGVKEETNLIIDKFKSDIDLIVTLSQEEKSHYKISGENKKKFYFNNIFYSDSYKLSSSKCLDFFQKHKFDLGIVVGWQRLIPQEILDCFKIGIFGFHASPIGLPYGKGRSPANWSLILGFNHVFNHFFKYDSKADNGEIYKNKKINILPWDNIKSLKEKILLDQINSIKDLIRDYNNNNIKLSEQNKSIFESFFPKRSLKDGKINFTNTTENIYNLIRGCSYPFPGAFVDYNNNNITIWEAYPFSYEDLFPNSKVGQIVKIYDDKSFIFKTIDGSILVKKWETKNKLNINLGKQLK